MITTILVIANLVMMVMAVWQLASDDKFFTRIESGNQKFVIRGNTYARTIAEGSSSLLKSLGLFWVGIFPVYQVHEFEILVDKEDPHAQEVKDWVKQPGVKRPVKSLRKLIPRPVLMLATELEVGRSTVDILLSLIFEVVDGRRFVFDMKADFTPVVSVIQTEVINTLKGVGLDDFLKTKGGDQTHNLLAVLVTDGFNSDLVNLFGLKLVSAGISNLQVSDIRLRQAMEAEQVAIREGNATRERAKAEADAMFTKAEKEAEAIRKVGDAKNAILKGSVESLAGITPEAGGVLEAEYTGRAIEVAKPTTVLVGGSNPTPTIQIPTSERRR